MMNIGKVIWFTICFVGMVLIIPFVILEGLSEEINYVRGVYEYNDLQNNINPINFATSSSINGYNLSVNSIVKQQHTNVLNDGSNYYILLNEDIKYLSSNITYTFSIIRSSPSHPTMYPEITPVGCTIW
jgi:hypothetical protein